MQEASPVHSTSPSAARLGRNPAAPSGLQEDGDQSQMRGFLPGTPAQDLRQWQSDQGAIMHTSPMIAALP